MTALPNPVEQRKTVPDACFSWNVFKGVPAFPASPICSWRSLHPIRILITQHVQIGIIKCEQGKKYTGIKHSRLNTSRRGLVPPAPESPDPTIVITSHHPPPPRSPMGHTHTADPRPPPPDKYAFASTAGQDQGGEGMGRWGLGGRTGSSVLNAPGTARHPEPSPPGAWFQCRFVRCEARDDVAVGESCAVVAIPTLTSGFNVVLSFDCCRRDR